jgi:formylglycine-generating enzyme required for sulfatase activity
MELSTTRELARLASILDLLRAQREVFSELSDIKEFRGLEAEFSDALREARSRGLVTQDPVSVVRADWQRLVLWSNRVQEALRETDEMGQELSADVTPEAVGGRKRKRAQGEWKPNLAELRQLEQGLRGAPARLAKGIDQARAEVRDDDWNGHRPYSELTEVADALGWKESLELAEPLGSWADGVPPRARPLVATRLTTEIGSPMLQRRMDVLRVKLSEVLSLQEKHASHSSALEEVGRLVDAGQVETARRLMDTVPIVFGDLDYAGTEQKLAQLEKRLKSQGETVTETRSGLQVLVREAGGFFAFPPIGLLRRGGVALGAAEKVVRETAQLGREGGASEVDRMVSAWVQGLKSEVDSFRALSMGRVRRWIWGGALFWLIVFIASGVTFQQIQARQERERQRIAAEAKAAEEAAEKERQRLAAIAEQERLRLAAEAKAAEERALAAAKAKAAAEERERQRVAAEAKAAAERSVAEAKAKKEPAETAIAMKPELSRPFGPGLRGVVGEIVVRWIPSGRFTMGSPSSEKGRDTDEVEHEVVLSWGLFLAETECTQGQWEAVMGSNPSYFKGTDRPVEQVSWEEAVEFCRKLTLKQRQEGVLPEGWEWRLPTESEWEYAARAGTTGARHGELDSIAWHGGNSGDKTHGVKGKQANAWGLHDMIGNVSEWCGDWYGEYPTGNVTDPSGPSSGYSRVYRGGSWVNDAGLARSAFRFRFDPGFRSNFLGFRPALSSVR